MTRKQSAGTAVCCRVIPVDQTTFGRVEGNCFSACVASILELDIEQVPWFMGSKDWWPGFTQWCDAVGAEAMYLGMCAPDEVPRGYAIGGGPTDRTLTLDTLHAVVLLDGVQVHDPHPSRAMLLEVTDYILVWWTADKDDRNPPAITEVQNDPTKGDLTCGYASLPVTPDSTG